MVVSFQAAAKKRSRRHLAETDEYVSNNEFNYMDTVAMATAYKKMTSICLSFKNEIFTDIEIHNQHTLPRQVFSLNVMWTLLKQFIHMAECDLKKLPIPFCFVHVATNSNLAE